MINRASRLGGGGIREKRAFAAWFGREGKNYTGEELERLRKRGAHTGGMMRKKETKA